MNITYAQIGSTGSAVATFPSNVAANSLLVLVLLNHQLTQGTLAVSDNINGNWTLAGSTISPGTNGAYIYYLYPSGAGATTITVTLTGGSTRTAITFIAREFPGTLLGGGSVFQAFQGANSSSSPLTTASITTTANNQLLVSLGAATGTISSGYAATESGYPLAANDLKLAELPTSSGLISLFDMFEPIGTYTSSIQFTSITATYYAALAAFNFQPSDVVGVTYDSYTGVLPPDAQFITTNYNATPILFGGGSTPNVPVPIFLVIKGGTVGVGYSETVSETGGLAPFTFSNPGGGLPTGLSLSGNLISGTPTTAGTYNFNITVTDANGANTTITYQITISSPVSSGGSWSWVG